MSTYFEVLIIFIFCTFLYSTENINIIFLTFFLLAIILTCFMIATKREKVIVALTVFAFILCVFYPNFVYFFPAFFYLPFAHKKYIFCTIGILFALYNIPSYTRMFPLLCAFGLSFYLAYQGRERELLKTSVKQLRDDSVEQAMYLEHKNAQLLSHQDDEIYIATLKERNRIAREIHDNVGHMLSRSILQVGALLAICKDELLTQHLEGLKLSLDDAMNSIRTSIHNLHDESVDLKSSLQNLTDNFTFCAITLDYGLSRNVPKEIKYCFITITKEALNNVTKHSNATRVSVTAKEHPGLYQLLIEDNGTNPFSQENTSGIGLSNMRDRVDALHGIIQITSENGVKIFISIPKQQSAQPAPKAGTNPVKEGTIHESSHN